MERIKYKLRDTIHVSFTMKYFNNEVSSENEDSVQYFKRRGSSALLKETDILTLQELYVSLCNYNYACVSAFHR